MVMRKLSRSSFRSIHSLIKPQSSDISEVRRIVLEHEPQNSITAEAGKDFAHLRKIQRKVGNHTKKNNLHSELRRKYNSEYTFPTAPQQGSINHFFNAASVSFEWSASKFLDIPGEKLKCDIEEKALRMNAKLKDDEKFDRSVSLGSDKLLDNSTTNEIKSQNKIYPRKTDGIPFELLNGLPEVAFLGRCNAGKSTLLNNLTTEFSQVKLNEYAKSSRKAGFTKTINCFNIGRRFRIIDTPGYGVRSTQDQGETTMQYLRERKELRRCFVLISAEQGFSPFDSQIIEFLRVFGIPFEIVFTKVDKIREISKIERMIEESGVLELPTLPQIIFLNSVTTKDCKKGMVSTI